MECAGNGRALLDPRPLSQPWLGQGVGTAEWTGTPLAPILADAGIESDACRPRLRRRRPRHPGRGRTRLRTWALGRERDAAGGDARLWHERRLAPTPARLPAPPAGARLVRHDERQVADLDHGHHGALRRLPADQLIPLQARRRRSRRSGRTDARAGADDPARHAGLLHTPAIRRSGTRRASAAAPGPAVARSSGSRSARVAPGPTPSSTRRWATSPGAAGRSTGTPSPATASSSAGRPTRPARSSRSSHPGTTRAWATTASSGCRSPSAERAVSPRRAPRRPRRGRCR